jgi:hypothetical protein
VSDVIAAFRECKETERGRDQVAHVIETAWPRRSEERLQFGEREFNRVEVRTVGRKKPDLRADGFNRRADRRLFVHDEVVEPDDVTGAQRRGEDLFDVGEETRIVDGSIEHGGRAQALEPQRGDDGGGLPVAAGRVVVEPFATRTASVAAQQISGHPTFVEEYVLARVTERQPLAPVAPRGDDIRASLFVGVYRFF